MLWMDNRCIMTWRLSQWIENFWMNDQLLRLFNINKMSSPRQSVYSSRFVNWDLLEWHFACSENARKDPGFDNLYFFDEKTVKYKERTGNQKEPSDILTVQFVHVKIPFMNCERWVSIKLQNQEELLIKWWAIDHHLIRNGSGASELMGNIWINEELMKQ